MLLCQGLEKKTQEQKTSSSQKLNASFQKNPKPNDFISWASSEQSGHYMPFKWKQRSAAVLTHPIHYSIYSSHFSLFLELHVEMVVVWYQGLKGSVDLTLKAKSRVLSHHRK